MSLSALAVSATNLPTTKVNLSKEDSIMRRRMFGTILLVLLSATTLWAVNPFGDGGNDPEIDLVRQREALQKKCDALLSQKLAWRSSWMAENVSEDDLSKLAVELSKSTVMNRNMLKKYLNDRALADKSYNNVLKNLDIGRHQFLKTLFARSLEETNKRLAAKKLTPLSRTSILNSGGTGNFTRDIDVTVFAGDDVRETTFFEAMRDISRQMGLRVNTGPGGSVKNGIELADLEVAFHRGYNDLPDARYASDPVEFHLNYRRVIETQSRNPEAYFGYGSDTEVVGRRFLSFKPGQTLVQTLEVTGQGVRYTGQIASCMREARGILRGSNDLRIRKAQRAIHATNDYLQAWRHSQHEGGSPTQGALKYAARSLDELCAFHGFKNWSELVLEDRVQLLARMYGPKYLDEPSNRQKLMKMAEALETASMVLLTKNLPSSLAANTPEAQQKLAMQEHAAMAFLRDSCGSMASSVAQEMLDPPMLDRRFLDQVNREDHVWHDMTAAERDAYARHHDSIYKRCMSASAMENLLVLMEQLKVIDNVEAKGRKQGTGESALKKIIDSADPSLRPVLQAAAEHAEASVVLLNADSTPEARAQAEKKMASAREKLSGHLKKAAPGDEILGIAKGMSPRDFIRMQNLNRPPFWGQALEEMKGRMRKHIEDSFPENSYESVKRQVAEYGMKGYLAKRVYEEVFQIGNVVDALTLVEMYQGGAGKGDYAWFFTQNLLARCYWGLGYLMQATQVKDAESLKLLGKNLVFDAFSRLIPGVAHVKILFEIERGLVVVTVGWALNQANTQLIDALYTGPAGRLSNIAEGTVGGRIRDSGFCVLDGKHVIKVTDKKTQQTSIQIDQPGLYQLYYQKWIQGPAGRELPYDEINVRPAIAGDVGKRLAAHDKFAKAILDIGADIEPSWFGPRKAWQDKDELDKAMSEFVQLISPLCRAETDRVLSESAVRQFFQDGRDVIADGLQQRLVSDIIVGMIAIWQTHRLEIQYAKRQIQYMAGLADKQAVSELLAAPITGGPMPNCDLEVDLNLRPRQKAAYTRFGYLPISCRLKVDASMPPDMKDVGINMEPLEFTVTNKHEYGKTTLAMEGIQKVRLTARAKKGEGELLAEKIAEFPLTIYPDPLSIARLSDRVRLNVAGPGEHRESTGDVSREYQGVQNCGFCVPYPNREHPPAGVKIAWSGNNFSVDYREEIAQPWPRDPLRGPVNVKATITGTLDPDKRLLSFKAEQTLVEKESYGNGQLRRVSTTTHSCRAQNLVADEFTGFGSDLGIFRADRHAPGPKPQVNGKVTEVIVDYDDDGKVRYQTTKTTTVSGVDGSSEMVFSVSWIQPPMPGVGTVAPGTPIKVNVR